MDDIRRTVDDTIEELVVSKSMLEDINTRVRFIMNQNTYDKFKTAGNFELIKSDSLIHDSMEDDSVHMIPVTDHKFIKFKYS